MQTRTFFVLSCPDQKRFAYGYHSAWRYLVTFTSEFHAWRWTDHRVHELPPDLKPREVSLETVIQILDSKNCRGIFSWDDYDNPKKIDTAQLISDQLT